MQDLPGILEITGLHRTGKPLRKKKEVEFGKLLSATAKSLIPYFWPVYHHLGTSSPVVSLKGLNVLIQPEDIGAAAGLTQGSFFLKGS